jgi:thymidylate kinase
MITVALIGPDGAGKSTVSRRLERELPFPVRSMYMGVNLEGGGPMLPTTRLALAFKRRRGTLVSGPNTSHVRRGGARARAKAAIRLVFWTAEEWFRLLLALYHQRRGRVVIFDRHFFADYYHYEVAGSETLSLSQRIHGFALRRLYPKPDLVVCLDAPGEVLFARKGEGTPEWLEQRRAQYLDLARSMPEHAIVDATQDVDVVVGDVARAVERLRSRHMYAGRAS